MPLICLLNELSKHEVSDPGHACDLVFSSVRGCGRLFLAKGLLSSSIRRCGSLFLAEGLLFLRIRGCGRPFLAKKYYSRVLVAVGAYS